MKTAFLLVVSCFIISTVTAQKVTAERYTVSGGVLGAANFSKFKLKGDNALNIDYETKVGWGLGGWVNFPVTNGFSIEPQIVFNSYRYRTDSMSALLINNGSVRYLSIPLALKFHLGNNFAIGVGPQVDFRTSVDDDENPTPLQEEDFNATSFSLFGGVELFPHGRVSVFARYIHGMSDMDNRAVHGTEGEYKNRNFQVGLKLKLFGGKKVTETLQATTPVLPPDRDGDGITDDVDKCPDVAGLAKYDGCPIPDTDGDGINDELDKCPTVAGLAKYEGCPIPDTDGDGINDELDKCPTVAGLAKYDGCPIPDKDGDGVNDEEDKCPDVPGTVANKGCPDVPADVSKSLSMSAQSIAFGSGNATLTTRSNASLDRIVTVMNENPTLHVRVAAHTDNAGDDDANMKLSEDRAAAVKAYLVSKGISEDRIVSEGFGETMPIADNNTSAGRVKNRRVEVKVEY